MVVFVPGMAKEEGWVWGRGCQICCLFMILTVMRMHAQPDIALCKGFKMGRNLVPRAPFDVPQYCIELSYRE